MTSIVDDLRRRTAASVRRMPVAERIALALTLGDQDLDLYMRVNGLGRHEARRALCAQRARGRTQPSAAANPSR